MDCLSYSRAEELEKRDMCTPLHRKNLERAVPDDLILSDNYFAALVKSGNSSVDNLLGKGP